MNISVSLSSVHRRQKRTASHSILAVEELKTRDRLCRPVLCSFHPGQELRLFCEPCDLPVCLECGATLHRDHLCFHTQDVIDRHGDRIRELVSACLRPRLERLETSLQKVLRNTPLSPKFSRMSSISLLLRLKFFPVTAL